MVSITGYTDPGVYIGEVQTPGSINVTASRALCLVGLAPRTKRATDEVVVRGKIYDEELATWSAASPYSHILANVCNKDRTNAILYKNDNAMGYGEWSFAAATLVGTEWAGATIDVSSLTGTAQYFTMSADGLPVVTIDLDAAVTAVGGAPATASGVEIADAINYELSDALGTYFSEWNNLRNVRTVSRRRYRRLPSYHTTVANYYQCVGHQDFLDHVCGGCCKRRCE